MEFVQIKVSRRESTSASALRRLRQDGLVPAVLYGMKRPNLNISIPATDLARFLESDSHLIELKMGDKTRRAILREAQVDALTDRWLHADFYRVDDDVEVDDHVRITTKGRAKGEDEGGVVQVLIENVSIRAKPKDLLAELIVDLSGLALGDSILVKDLHFEEGVTVLNAEDEIVLQVVAPKVVSVVTEEEPEAEEPEGEGEAAAESDD